jgi:hypothetical protein
MEDGMHHKEKEFCCHHFCCNEPLLGNLEEGFESWMKGLWGWGIALSRGLR